MKFQPRDGVILLFIYLCGGVVAVRHLWRLFWRDSTLRAVQRRVQKLCAAGYLARPTGRQYRIEPIPEAVVWLGWWGILYLAGQRGVVVDPPSNPKVDYQLKKLARTLRKQDIRWVWRPRWNKLHHDLKIVDFRLALEEALHELPALVLETWLNESIFRTDMDEVTFEVRNGDGGRKQEVRGVIPDAYFVIAHLDRKARDLPFQARHLLEVDMASHSNPSFGRDKVLPYVAYLNSPQYGKRFGSNLGRWLIVTTGKRRLEHLMRQTKQVVDKNGSVFYFITFDDVAAGNVLIDPIWWQVGESEPVALFPPEWASRASGIVSRPA